MAFDVSFEGIRKFGTRKCEVREHETEECETGAWKVDRGYEAEIRDCDELLSFPSAHGDERQEFRALLERGQRRAGRPGRLRFR